MMIQWLLATGPQECVDGQTVVRISPECVGVHVMTLTLFIEAIKMMT